MKLKTLTRRIENLRSRLQRLTAPRLSGQAREARAARYFDPLIVRPLFDEWKNLQNELRVGSGFPESSQIAFPKPSNTSDFDGRGYIERMHIERLLDDVNGALGYLARFDGDDDYTETCNPGTIPEQQAREPVTHEIPQERADRIFIIHGRNTDVLVQLRIWLESLGLHAKGFDELRAELGGSPSIMEVLKKGMTEAHGIIALMTPDEIAFLRPELWREHDLANDKERWQARPNVIFEAGMAFALAGERRTLILVAGDIGLFSDVSGIHFLRVPQDPTERELLKTTLLSMGCAVRENPHHHSRGDFGLVGVGRPRVRSPFEISEE